MAIGQNETVATVTPVDDKTSGSSPLGCWRRATSFSAWYWLPLHLHLEETNCPRSSCCKVGPKRCAALLTTLSG